MTQWNFGYGDLDFDEIKGTGWTAPADTLHGISEMARVAARNLASAPNRAEAAADIDHHVGIAPTPAVVYNTAALLNDNVAAVADIDAPSAWTTLFEYTSPKRALIHVLWTGSGYEYFGAQVYSGQTARLRIRIRIDGRVVFDAAVGAAGGTKVVAPALPKVELTNSAAVMSLLAPLYTVQFQVCRQGAFTTFTTGYCYVCLGSNLITEIE